MTEYNSFPLGQVPEALQRPELKNLKKLGYKFDDPREVVDIFEKKVARFAGSEYAVSIDCCSHGVFLALKYLTRIHKLPVLSISIPRHTYVSIPMQIEYANRRVIYDDRKWTGVYQLRDTRVWDGAVRWTKDMYVGGDALQVVSFQYKKRIPIGKGGMILTDDKLAYDTLKLMSYDGRDLSLPYDHPDHIKCFGYHMYCTPEDAARGIMLMDNTPKVNEDSGDYTKYPDVERMMNNIL